MARVLIVTTGRTSFRNRCVELARRLTAAGHDVSFAGPEKTRAAIEAESLTFAAIRTDPAGISHRAGGLAKETGSGTGGPIGKTGRWLRRARSAPALRSAARDGLVDEAYLSLLERLDPDLVAVEIELQAYVIASYRAARRTAVLSSFISTQRIPGVPPLHTSIQPGKGVRGSGLGVWWAWLRYGMWKRWSRLREWVRSPGCDRVSVLRALAEEHNFPHRAEFALQHWLIPLSFQTLPTLNLNAVEFDFPHRVHPTQHYTGPLVRAGASRPTDAGSSANTQQVADFLYDRDSSRPLIYCAFGTAFAGDDSAFLRELLVAVREKAEWDVLVSLGGRDVLAIAEPLPDHIRVFPWVPQIDVLEHADCAVLHAGPASICECVQFGVPMLLYPFAVNDQLGYAARASYHGLAHIGDRQRDHATAIAERIEGVLADSTLGPALASMRAHFAGYVQNDAAVGAVEALLPQ